MKRAVVTGGTGFVGANLVRRLLSEGHEVHLLVSPRYTAWRIDAIRNDVHVHEADLADRDGVERVIADVRPQWVFHLAAHGAYSWQAELKRIVETNILGTVHLVEACLKTGFEAFVNTGSSSEYGFKDHPPAEDEVLDPNSHYAVTKASATLFCRYTAQSRKVPIRTLRLYNIYGPYEEPKRLIPTVIVKGLKNEWPPMVDPAVSRDFVHVDDVVDAYLLAATSDDAELGAIYNLGTGTQTSMRDVADIARRVMQIGAGPAWGTMQKRIWDTSTWVARPDKITARLGWRPKFLFRDGFQATVEWFRSNAGMLRYYEQCQAS